MDNVVIWFEWWKIVVPAVIGVLGSLLALAIKELIAKKSNKKTLLEKRLHEQLDNLYLPFVVLYFTEVHGAHNYLDFDEPLRKEFTDFILGKFQYVNSQKLMNLIHNFKMVYSSYIIGSNDIDTIDALNNAFNEIVDTVHDEYNSICKTLGIADFEYRFN